MRIELKPGARHRKGDTWVQVAMVVVDGQLLHGHIKTTGRRKRAERAVTYFGSDKRAGSDPYWLAARNGIAIE